MARKQKRTQSSLQLQTPAHYSAIVEGAMDQDQDFFDRNPNSKQYDRDYIPGEFWPYMFPICTRVTVTYLGPGLRTREPDTDSIPSVAVLEVSGKSDARGDTQ